MKPTSLTPLEDGDDTIASWVCLVLCCQFVIKQWLLLCRSLFDYTLGKRFQVMGHGLKVRSKLRITPILMLKPLPQYGWKLGTQHTQKSAVILGMSQKYKPPFMNRGNGKPTIHRFVSHIFPWTISIYIGIFHDFPTVDTGGYCGIPHFDLFSGQHLEHHSGVDFQDPKEPPQLMLPEVIALSTSAIVFRLGTGPGIYFSSTITGEKCDIPWLCSWTFPFGQLTGVFEHGWTMCLRFFQSLSSSCFSVPICTARQCHSCLRQSAAPWNATVLRFVAFGHCCDAGECWRMLAENRIRKHCKSGDGGV